MGPLLFFGRYRDIAAAAAERLAADASAEVIVASGGMRKAVLAELLARTPNGVSAARLEPLERFARRVVNDAGDYPHVATDAERRLAMRTAARSIDDPMLDSRGIAAMLERSYRDVRDAGVTLHSFESRLRGTRALRNRARTTLVLRVWREYERLIAALGAIDPADLLSRAAAAIGPQTKPQLVAGFYDMTGAQLLLIEALRDAGKLDAVFIPTTGDEAYIFAKPFIQRLTAGDSALSPQPSLLHTKCATHTIAAHSTRDDELRAVCAGVSELLANGMAAREIGIVARSLEPQDIDRVNRAAAAHGFLTTATDELPLRAQRLGRGLATLLRLRERGFPRADVFELLRDGLRTARRIAVDEADLATRRARIAGGASAELRPLSKKPLVDDYIAVVAELETLTSPLAAPMTGNDWASFLGRTTALFRMETQLDLDAAECIDAIAALFRSAATWQTRFDLAAVEDALAHAYLRPRAEASALPVVWLGDVMGMRGRTFQHLFAVRMQDDVFPQRRTDDPLLPDSDRRALRLREIGDGRDEERLLFRLLLDSAATTVHFTFAGGDGFGKTLRPSQLLKTFAVAQEPQRRAELLRHFAKSFVAPEAAASAPQRPAAERQLQLLAKSGTQSVFDGYLTDPALRAHFARALESVTPTQLEDFGECPQKFLVKHLLGAFDVDAPDRELQMHPREKGSLDHGILERFYRILGDEVIPLDDELRARLHAIVDEEFDRIEAQAPPFNRTWREIERRATKRALSAFVSADLEELLERGLTPRWFEYSFGRKYAARGEADHEESFVIDAHGIAVRVDGRIDRIDEGANGELRIVDYKSGKALRHKDLSQKIDRGVRLQLALYAMAVADFFSRQPSAVSGTIKPLVIEAKAGKFAFSLAGQAERLVGTLDLFARSILGGLFPAFPGSDDDDVNACKYCPVAHSCRTRHDAAERQAVRRWKEPRALLEGTPS
jgi:RecB family exonuclease